MASYRWDEDILVPIVPCPRCGQRFVEDPNRDGLGNPIALEPGEEEREPSKCDECMEEVFYEALEADVLHMLEHRLGLTEENKKTFQALGSFIENPDRLVMVASVQDRVDELERRLEDRTESLRDVVDSKLENAGTRLFFAMLIISVLTFLLGVAIGVVVTLVLGA